jgi:hypothetical protein
MAIDVVCRARGVLKSDSASRAARALSHGD